MIITGKHLPRRTFLEGMGAMVALPMLDAMIPTGIRRVWGKGSPSAAKDDPTRLVCIEMVHGAAGCNTYGASQNYWSPAVVGRDFDLTPTALQSLEQYRKYLTIVSGTDVRMAVLIAGHRRLQDALLIYFLGLEIERSHDIAWFRLSPINKLGKL